MSQGAETIEAGLARLARLHPKSIDLSLERINRLLAALDDPHLRLPPVIHIAGTNGKGSTAAFLKAIGEAAGERVHVYTSPHLVRFNERIVLAGQVVDDDRLRDAFARCEAANGAAEITFFEITTAAAFLLFAETPADRVILETGLGGRVDATNVIAAPQCTVITPVGLDHQGFLGETISEIAGEKAGIIKPGVPVICAPQTPEAMRAIELAAAKARAPLTVWERDFTVRPEHGGLVYEAENLLWDLPAPGLLGPHQIVNAGVAAAAARACGYEQDAVRAGIANARWPARLQRLTSGPLADIAQAGQAELWLDGGHNPAAAEALASALGEMEAARERPLVLICAMSRNKDAKAFLRWFSTLAARVIAVTFSGGREGALTAQELAEAARAAGLPAQTCAGLIEAVHDALEDYVSPRIVICGSLYLAGEVLALEGGDRVQATPG
ncbi:bifunctional folylpolyglutamate synthase/dihydrofolate synthase [Alkalicaulis satelles]|uniref:Dihydrofolate synthase/folylpolyglutamate synthase n=1 Tax=Alkalicaulis satelles TaxID=2609175 RepID=A0A5M6ZG69_9PROT|nr:folylpolyglutamate synthase/dihydrofolate synthase family protein [Alkalicaulis satelles]KAA5803752.1 bifunctional folylpolyglutamate synthase/dihydrofolate synthase [Alkalicaulis satelles]